MAALLGVLFAFGLLAGICVLDALVLKVLWGWFLVPLGLPPIGLAMAVGLGAIMSLISYTPIRESEDGEELEDLAKGLINSLLKMAILLGIGWIAHKCM